jgi:15-cis-phytoene synthase
VRTRAHTTTGTCAQAAAAAGNSTQADHATPCATRGDHAACGAAIRAGSKTFFAASLLLPRRVRRPALALYAFCRLADDQVDNGGQAASLQHLRERLARIYVGRPSNHAADRALTDVVAEHGIPRELPEALLEGFEWDLAGRRYEDGEQLNAYASRVAGAVGEMMAHLMNVRSADALARASDLGIAMQLTNIARDVGEDARAGRLYLPATWLRQVGVEPDEWLTSPVFSPQIRQVIERVLNAAEALYERADAGIALLPKDCRPGISAARQLYAEIGHQLLREGCDSVSRRTVVPAARKMWIVASAAARAIAPSDGGRAEWLLTLFERLERRDRERPAERRQPDCAL